MDCRAGEETGGGRSREETCGRGEGGHREGRSGGGGGGEKGGGGEGCREEGVTCPGASDCQERGRRRRGRGCCHSSSNNNSNSSHASCRRSGSDHNCDGSDGRC